MERRIKKYNNYKFKIKWAIVLFFLSLALIANVYLGIAQSKLEKHILTKNTIVMHNGTKVFEGDIDDYKLVNVKAQDIFTMYMKVPKNNIVNPAIQYDNINTAVKIYVEGKKVYSIGDNVKAGGVVCHMHNKAPLGEIKEGQEIKMTIRVMDKSGLTRLPRIKLMNTRDIERDFLASNIDNLIYSSILFVLGIFGIVLLLCNGTRDGINKKIFILTFLCLSTFISIVSTYQIFQIICDNAMLDMYLEYINRFVVLILIAAYMHENARSNKLKKIFKAHEIIIGLFGVIVVTLQELKISYINDTLWLYYVFMFSLIVMIAVSLLENKNKEEKIQMFLLACIASGGIIIFYLFLFTFLPQMSADVFMYFPDVQFIFIVVMFIELIYNLEQSYRTDAEQKALNELAYIDKLTALGNRRAFERYINTNINRSKSYKVFLFDLNGLKKVNDTYGHNAGDSLLKNFAQILAEVFARGFCARTGGDEFLAIIENESNNQTIIKKLKKQVFIFNSKNRNDYKLGYSVGEALYTPQSSNIDDIIKKADENMYKMKRNVKRTS